MAFGASIFAFSFSPITELIDIIANPKQTLTVTLIQIPFIMLTIFVPVISLKLPMLLLIPITFVISILINEMCIKIAVRKIEPWDGWQS